MSIERRKSIFESSNITANKSWRSNKIYFFFFFDFFIITVHSIFLRRTEKSDRFVVLCVSGGDIAFEMKKKRAEEENVFQFRGAIVKKWWNSEIVII